MAAPFSAKVKVTSVNQLENAEILQLKPVHSGSEENKQWSQWTPSGNIELTITNTELHGKFKVGEEYLVNFTPCEK